MPTEQLRGLRYALARVTIEFTSPLTIGTGRGDDLSDSPCVLDANGLPTIPGSSLAGVLRAAWQAEYGEAEAKRLFGHQSGSTGASSRVELSWGQVHTKADTPVPLLDPELKISSDEVLRFLSEGVLRDHVRINHRGIADDTGKFDELLVPKGARFTFEVLVHAQASVADARKDLDALLALLAGEMLRIGGRTRRGHGAFALQRALVGSFDLTTDAGRRRALQLKRALHEVPSSGKTEADAPLVPWAPPKAKAPAVAHHQVRTVILQAQDLFLFGTGIAVRPEHRVGGDANAASPEKAHDKVPLTERSIQWVDGKKGVVTASEQAEVLIPATGVKGALRHRALYHARRLAGVWADVGASYTREAAERPEDDGSKAIEALFGAIKRSDDDDPTGHPGRVFLSDIRLAPAAAPSLPVQHVSLDRFTQGPMDGLLFSEAPNHANRPLSLRIELKRPPTSPDGWDLGVRALNCAIEDLVGGRLALGSGSNRGHGYFEGVFPDPFHAS